jgi:hypothetical protein
LVCPGSPMTWIWPFKLFSTFLLLVG